MNELYLQLQDEAWPFTYTDHHRQIARAIVFDEKGKLYFVRASRDDAFGQATIIETSGGGLEPGNFTIVFADALEDEAIKTAVRSGCCVAGCENKLYGDYRLVKYAYFLHKNYFPKHYKKRAALGAWMLRMASSGGTVNAASDEKNKIICPSDRFPALRYSE